MNERIQQENTDVLGEILQLLQRHLPKKKPFNPSELVFETSLNLLYVSVYRADNKTVEVAGFTRSELGHEFDISLKADVSSVEQDVIDAKLYQFNQPIKHARLEQVVSAHKTGSPLPTSAAPWPAPALHELVQYRAGPMGRDMIHVENGAHLGNIFQGDSGIYDCNLNIYHSPDSELVRREIEAYVQQLNNYLQAQDRIHRLPENYSYVEPLKKDITNRQLAESFACDVIASASMVSDYIEAENFSYKNLARGIMEIMDELKELEQTTVNTVYHVNLVRQWNKENIVLKGLIKEAYEFIGPLAKEHGNHLGTADLAKHMRDAYMRKMNFRRLDGHEVSLDEELKPEPPIGETVTVMTQVPLTPEAAEEVKRAEFDAVFICAFHQCQDEETYMDMLKPVLDNYYRLNEMEKEIGNEKIL